MPATVAAPAARAAGAALGRAAAGGALRGDDGGGGGPNALLLAAAVAVVIPTGVVVGLVVLVGALGGVQREGCESGGGSLPANFTGPGSLGQVGGTGISRALVERVRSGSPYAGGRIAPGMYSTTAYGPPWGGIQGAGVATSGGLPVRGGAPRWYMIAVDPSLIGHGAFVYVWPNPFAWKGPFLAADTGGAIRGRRVDFYDWRGRATQVRWGIRQARVSARPVAGGGGVPTGAALLAESGPGSAGCAGAGSLAGPGRRGTVTLAAGADRPGVPTRKPVIEFLERTAGVYGQALIVTTGTAHGQYSSSGSVSDHWVGLGADLGSVANRFQNGGRQGTRMAAAALVAAGVPERAALRAASSGGGHDVCHRGWRVQVIWRTGGHWGHVHIGLRKGCSHTGIRTFQI